MTDTAYLARVRLSSSSTPARLIKILKRRSDVANPDALAHHLIWALFPDMPDAERPFLYRDEGNGAYVVLSREIPPRNDDGLFRMQGPKVFAPVVGNGQMLRFRLRANPVVRRNLAETRTTKKGRVVARREKDDIVMARLKSVSNGERSEHRARIIQEAGRDWIESIGAQSGFELLEPDRLLVDNYRQQQIWRRGKPNSPTFSMLDFEGLLKVTDPATFLARLPLGFGSAKAFGCGLMLIRRA